MKDASGRFTGTSRSGDLADALRKAIAQAKEGLQSSLVLWEIVHIRGEDGGFTQVRDLTVTIDADYPAEAGQ